MNHNTDHIATIENLLEEAVERLAKLSPLAYDSMRQQEAETLGVRVTELDKAVKKARFAKESQDTDNDNIADEVSTGVEPWPEPVDTLELINEINQVIDDYCVLPEGGRIALCLWALGTYCFEAFTIYPRMLITSPEKGCGKSTALMVLQALSNRNMLVSNIKPAALFRCIELWHPTLLIDEGDTFLNRDNELVGIVNSSHTKGTASVLRCVGDDHTPKQFSTWSPIAIAMINLPRSAALLDRSIILQLKRKPKDRHIKRLPPCLITHLHYLRQKCQRWANDNIDYIRERLTTFKVPDIGSYRNQDNWLSLMVMASLVNEQYLDEAKQAMQLLELTLKDTQSHGNQLLEDIREIFMAGNHVYLYSADLVEKLIAQEERPWGEWRKGQPITPNILARLLKSYDIRSKSIRQSSINSFEDNTVKRGYRRDDLEHAWTLYLEPYQEDPIDE